MGRGGYNGGSTVIGAGRSWSFDPDFDYREYRRAGKPNRLGAVKRNPVPPAITVAGKPVGKKVLRKHRMAQLQKIDRDIVLLGLGHSLPKKPSERRDALKRLVAEKVLLQTGAINIGHSAVLAWLKTSAKNSKKGV